MAAAHSRGAFVRRWSLRVIWSLALVFATVVIGGALDATRRLPDLQPVAPHRSRGRGVRTLTELLHAHRLPGDRREGVQDRARTDRGHAGPRLEAPGQPLQPRRICTSFAIRGGLEPDADSDSPEVEPVGGALLVHGLTDAPYALRSIGQDLRQRGYYVVVLRVPGHGTVPAGLIGVTWEDWLAAVRVAARDIRAHIGTRTPLLLVGYSNGGAQVLKYALDVVEGSAIRGRIVSCCCRR